MLCSHFSYWGTGGCDIMNENQGNINVNQNQTEMIFSNIAPKERRLFGRKIIYADYKPSQLNAKVISKILRGACGNAL